MSNSDATEMVDALAVVEPLRRDAPPRVVGFDGDDTLWTSESLLTMTQGGSAPFCCAMWTCRAT